jgi:hypothetical protein
MSDIISNVLLSMSPEIDPSILARAAGQVAALGTEQVSKPRLEEGEADSKSEGELERIAI